MDYFTSLAKRLARQPQSVPDVAKDLTSFERSAWLDAEIAESGAAATLEQVIATFTGDGDSQAGNDRTIILMLDAAATDNYAAAGRYLAAALRRCVAETAVHTAKWRAYVDSNAAMDAAIRELVLSQP